VLRPAARGGPATAHNGSLPPMAPHNDNANDMETRSNLDGAPASSGARASSSRVATVAVPVVLGVATSANRYLFSGRCACVLPAHYSCSDFVAAVAVSAITAAAAAAAPASASASTVTSSSLHQYGTSRNYYAARNKFGTKLHENH